MNSQKKTLIVFNVDNVIDIITNSSSELFVLKGETTQIVNEMINNVYPGWENEYETVKNINELSNEELDTFLDYHLSSHVWPARKSQMPLLEGFEFDELYEPNRNYRTGEIEGPAWNGEIQYELKNNKIDGEDIWNRSFVTDENRERVIEAIGKTVGNYFLYSIDENPDWDMQEKLSEIGVRYHFG